MILECFVLKVNIMSILFDSHEDPTEQQAKKVRARNQQDERYPIQLTVDKYDDILIFGYQCKLFRDDQVAEDVNKGKFLIPWMGNKELMIDRYDCRGHLYRLEEFDFENTGEFTPLSPERQDVENVCDEERYMDLRKNTSEESILQEEEDKRGSALYDPFTAYQNIEYSYEDSSEGKTLSDCNSSTSNSNFDNDTYMQFCQYYGYNPNDANLKAYFQSQNSYQYDYDRPPPPSEPPPSVSPDVVSEPVSLPSEPTYEKFEPPVGVELPGGMELPETRKMQAIIEKTAMFISKQSAQMEIVLKTKQSGNPQFAFLDFDNFLNPYYKFMLGKIKDGEYEYADTKASEITKEEQNPNSGDDSDDGGENELHPLLQAHRRPLNQVVPSSPPIIPEVDIDAPIINQVTQTKMTGKIEDLAKVYMTWKYMPNPGEIPQDETGEEENKEGDVDLPSLEGVEELPPPPLPPPPSFVLADISDDNTEMNLSPQPSDVAPSSPPQHQDLEHPIEQIEQQTEQQIEEPLEQIEQPPQLIPGTPIFGAPMMPPPPPPSRPLFPQMRFQPSSVVQSHFPLQMGHRAFHPIPGHFLSGPFQHMPHRIQYSHPPELYQVRSSVPPPPPPPLPSLLPPGVDAPPMCSVNTSTSAATIVTTYEGAPLPVHTLNSQSDPVVMTHSHPSPMVSSAPPSLPMQDLPLLPPGVETDVNEKTGVPPPPPPPLPPSIDLFKRDAMDPPYNPIDALSGITEDKIQDNISFDNNLNETKVNNHQNNRTKQHGQEFNEESRGSSFGETIKNDNYSSSDEDFSTNKNKTLKQFSSRMEQSSCIMDSSSQYVDSEKQKKSFNRESKKRKRTSKFRSIDLKSDEDISHSPELLPEHSTFNIQYETESNNYTQSLPNYQQLNLQASSSQIISPFDQINETLKSIQGFSTSLCSTSQTTSNSSVTPLPTKIVTPGKDLQLVIDRLALYVAKNGEEFEVGIKEKKDPRFDFLNPWNIYHPYYANKKNINLEQVEKEKRKEDERRRNLKVKFGLKAKVKPVSVAKKKAAIATASVFNQNEEEDEMTEAPEGFQPNKDPEIEVKRRLQKQIEEKEKLLRQLHEQALLQQKIAEVNRQASIKPMLQNLTPQQQAMLKKKVHAKQSKKDNVLNTKQDERKKRAASFVGMLKKSSENEESTDLAGHFLRKRHFKETTGSKGNNSEPPDKASYEKKKDAFFKAINDAFKGT